MNFPNHPIPDRNATQNDTTPVLVPADLGTALKPGAPSDPTASSERHGEHPVHQSGGGNTECPAESEVRSDASAETASESTSDASSAKTSKKTAKKTAKKDAKKDVKKDETDSSDDSPNTVAAPNTRGPREEKPTALLSLERINKLMEKSLSGDCGSWVGYCWQTPEGYKQKDKNPIVFICSLSNSLRRVNFIESILPVYLVKRITDDDIVGNLHKRNNGRVTGLYTHTEKGQSTPFAQCRREALATFIVSCKDQILKDLETQVYKSVELSIALHNYLSGTVNFTLFMNDDDLPLSAEDARAPMGDEMLDGFQFENASKKNPELTRLLCESFYRDLHVYIAVSKRYGWVASLLDRKSFFDREKRAIREEKFSKYIAILLLLSMDMTDPTRTTREFFEMIYAYVGESIETTSAAYTEYESSLSPENNAIAEGKTVAPQSGATHGGREADPLDGKVKELCSKTRIYCLQEHLSLMHRSPAIKELINTLLEELANHESFVLGATSHKDKQYSYDLAAKACDRIRNDTPAIIDRILGKDTAP